MKNTLIFLALLSLSIVAASAQTTAIPDTAFEYRLVQLGIDSDGLVNGQIANSDGVGITTLNLNNSGITDLTGVELFAGLIDLYCSGNDLDSINISQLDYLSYLYCADNNLTTIDLSTCTTLTRLDCSGNDLDSLDVSFNLVLNRLDCSETGLNELDVSNNPALQRLYCSSNNLTFIDVTNNPNLRDFYCQDNDLFALNLVQNTALNYFNSRGNLSYLRICILNSAQVKAGWSKNSSARYSSTCFPKAVTGRVVMDDVVNCLADSAEQGFKYELVKFTKINDTTDIYFTTYDTAGNYIAFLDTGTYTASVILSSPYWQSCLTTQQVTVDSNYVVQTVDWVLERLIYCPVLEVDISAPFLRMTGGGSYYTVSYCNKGTTPALNAYVEVNLDDDLNFISAELPIASQVGTLYRFDLGTIGIGECGDFAIQVVVNTNAEIGQTHCSGAHIYPDSICLPIWSGPRVGGGVTCQNDSVFFSIQNTGASMAQPQMYTIIQDDIAMRTGNVQLGAGQSTVIPQEALPGSTYRIEVQQLTGYPLFLGDPIFSKAIEGCNPLPDGSFNTGFITQFSNGYSTPFKAINCQQNIASYDPNDKAAQPVGYDTAHYIAENIAIDYKVRFQNTGTDTAFNIVILDTLSTHVDVGSLQMGASSHSYSWLIEDGHVLKVIFSDILLVDSNANEPLSHGFFRYRIDQKANNPIGTLIENQAAIYFDYNPPIFTNTTFHTIGEDFVASIIVAIDRVYEERIEVSAYPNPFTHSTTIQVEGENYDELELAVFDVTGREIRRQLVQSNNRIELSKGSLQAGIYIYQLIGDHKLLNTGKLIVQE